ncbi:unnamed protein product [Candidula unifasciata]|uniref:DnaJ homolog subfamily C member 22 n=1 Tax=Candidula unifasciata TaxID=100452 RepID=A0A8S3YX61_9EUPU|nr:unnamed protein product [Candidula unifasciata]
MASTVIAYIIWLFLGWAGLHHLYLGRVNQAIVWFATFGGCGVGLIRDFWKIPEYVRWCNGDVSLQRKHLQRTIMKPRPGCSTFRFVGMLVMGLIAATVFSALVPDFSQMSMTHPFTYLILRCTYVALLMLGNGLGVYLVANIGELQCAKWYPFVASVGITPWLLDKHPNLLTACFFTALITWYKGLRWKPLPVEMEGTYTNKKFWKNVAIYCVACTVWLSVLFAGLYFNATITVEGGEKIPVREALGNFFRSDAWKRTKESLWHLLTILWREGVWHAWSDTRRVFDFSGEISAFKVLRLPTGATQEEILKQCRKLSAEHHPDRFKTPEEKELAQEKFIEIQKACTSLSSRQAKRARSNTKSTDNSDL